MGHHTMRLGPLVKSVLGDSGTLRCIQLGWDGGGAISSLLESVPKASVKVAVWGSDELPSIPGAESERCDLMSASFEREWDLVIIPSGVGQFVVCFYMAFETLLNDGGYVAVVEQEGAPSREWLYKEMVSEGKMASYPSSDERPISLFRHEAGRLTRGI